MKQLMKKPEHLLELGRLKTDIVLCGLPIILEAVIGPVTAFVIKADVLVSLVLIASVCMIGDGINDARP